MKLLYHCKIKTQFNIIIVSLLVLCLSLGSLVNYMIYSLMLNNTKIYARNTSLKFKNEINSLFEYITTVYAFLEFDTNIQDFFINPFTPHTIEQFNTIQLKFLSLSIINRDIVDIALVNEDIHYSNLFNYATLDKLHEQLKETSSLCSLGFLPSSFNQSTSNSTSNKYLVFGRNVLAFENSEYYGKPVGSIVLSLNPYVFDITLPRTDELNTYFILADLAGHTYGFNCNDTIAQDIVLQLTDTHFSTDSAYSDEIIEVHSPDYIVYASYLPSMKAYALSAVDKDKLLHDLSHTRLFIFAILSILILCMGLLMHPLLTSIINPIHKLYLFIKNVGNGHLYQLKTPPILKGAKEICELSYEFNKMLTEITSLNKQLFDTNNQLYESEIEKNKAEIAFLRSQINPHFLYNTLEAIRVIAHEHNVDQIATLCSSMGKIFHYSIKGSPTAPLTDELAITEAYLTLQLTRLDIQFDVFWSIHPSTRNCLVPKLILQPLVENAISYGFKKKTDIGSLYIGTLLNTDHQLQMIIQDDGLGIPSDKLHKLTLALNDTKLSKEISTSHIGILNVHNRLRLTYGPSYGIQIESRENVGTKIMLLLPITLIEKGDLHV